MKVAIFQFSLFGINTYVVYDPATSCCAIVDPGMICQQEEDAICNFIKRNGLTPTHVINTHLHVDHVAGNAFLRQRYNIPILANVSDEPLGSRVQQQAMMFGLKEKVEDVAISEYISNGDLIKIGNGELSVMSVPGHSPGSVALYDKEDKFVIVGDALFQGSIGRTDLPGGNYNTLIQSIRSQLFSLPDDVVVYPGHGPSTTIGQEKRTNPYLMG